MFQKLIRHSTVPLACKFIFIPSQFLNKAIHVHGVYRTYLLHVFLQHWRLLSEHCVQPLTAYFQGYIMTIWYIFTWQKLYVRCMTFQILCGRSPQSLLLLFKMCTYLADAYCIVIQICRFLNKEKPIFCFPLHVFQTDHWRDLLKTLYLTPPSRISPF